MMKKLISLVVALFFVPFVSASDVVIGEIMDMRSWQDGHTVIKVESIAGTGCSMNQYYSLGVKGADVKSEPMLSIALAAYLSGRKVRLESNRGLPRRPAENYSSGLGEIKGRKKRDATI